MDNRVIPILFTSAGRRVELLRCFRSAAERLGIDIAIHACDLDSELSAACQDADFAFDVPRCSAPDYVHTLFDYCRAHGIKLLVPTIDPELMPLAEARERFASIGCMLHERGVETIEIERDKAVTTKVLAEHGVPVPRTAYVDEVRAAPESWLWPLFIKPSAGSASRGIGLIHSVNEIADTYSEPMIVQENLNGDEYTVNIYVDADGELVTAVPHKRLAVRAGEVEKGITERRSDIRDLAERVVTALPNPSGIMCFQLIEDADRGVRVFEINARFGGGYPLADRAGGRFAESLLARVASMPECASDEWSEGVKMLRYDAAVFRD